jgi:hypothetical protein
MIPTKGINREIGSRPAVWGIFGLKTIPNHQNILINKRMGTAKKTHRSGRILLR